MLPFMHRQPHLRTEKNHLFTMWLFNIENDALSPWEEHQLTLILVSFNIIFALSLVLACILSHCFIHSYAQEKDDIVV